MIYLVQPPNLRGTASGGYRFNTEFIRRLESSGLGRGLDVALDSFAATAPAELAEDDNAVLVVDSLFLSEIDPPDWLSELGPTQELRLLLHYLPSANPLETDERRAAFIERERRWSERAHGLIATGAMLAEECGSRWGLPYSVVTPGVASCFRLENIGGVRKQPGLQIVTVGAVVREKGQLDVLRMLEAHAERAAGAPIRFVVVGDAGRGGDCERALRAEAKRVELVLLGDLAPEEVADVLSASDLYVSASCFESYGMAVAEAAAAGLPVLAYRRGEAARWVREGRNGVLIEPGDATAFENQLRTWLDHPDQFAELGLSSSLFFPTWDRAFEAFARGCRPVRGVDVRGFEPVRYAECELPTDFGVFDVVIYRLAGGEEAILIAMGDLKTAPAPFVRIHSECFTAEALHSLKCDCRTQLQQALQAVSSRGVGAILYLRQEGRGIGLGDKIRAYAEQQRGADTIEANERLGLAVDLREFESAGRILKQLGVRAIQLNTNNPDKVVAVEDAGIRVEEVIASTSVPNPHNVGYLQTKMRRLGHVGLQETLQELEVGRAPDRQGSHASNGNGSREGLLAIFDLDGVIQLDDGVPAEAVEMLDELSRRGVVIRYLTNDGINTRAIRAAMLAKAGLEVSVDHIFTGASLTARYVREECEGPVLALCGEPALEEFAGIPLVREHARTVIVGDFFDHYDAALLKAAHQSLEAGAELVAIHRKPTWPHNGQRVMDLGFWVAGLEYCAKRPARVVAKPSPYSYQTVLNQTGFRADQAIMISDEEEPDLEGARRCGIETMLFAPSGAGNRSAGGNGSAGRRDGMARTYAEVLERVSRGFRATPKAR